MLGIEDLSDSAVMAEALACLRQKLRRKHTHVDEHSIDSSIEDALLRLRACPDCYDAARGAPLLFYLELLARRYLYRHQRKEKCHRRHEEAVGVSDKIFEKKMSGMTAGGGIYLGRDRSEQEAEEREEEDKKERERQLLKAIEVRLNPCDRAGVQLLHEGASREKWMQHLGIEGLAREKQQRRIDGEKDRLKKKLRRWAQKMPGGLDFGTGEENANHC